MPEPGQPAPPFEAWPSSNYTDKKEVYINGEAIEIFHREKAHTDADSIVFFQEGGTQVISGHGRLAEESDVVEVAFSWCGFGV